MENLTEKEKYLTSPNNREATRFLIEAIKKCPKNNKEMDKDQARHLLGGTIELEELRYVGDLDCEICWVAIYRPGLCEVYRDQNRAD